MKGIEGIDEAKAALLPWLIERAKDAATLKQPLVGMLFLVRDVTEPAAEQLIFSDPLFGHDDVDGWVDELLEQAANACDARTGRVRFVVRIKDDSRYRRFTLHSGPIADALESNRVLAVDDDRAPERSSFVPSETLIDRVLWSLFAAAAISNTAQMVKPTTDDKPSTPKGTGGRPTVASRQYTSVAADTVAQYATRVANEMLKSYRERWKKR